MALVWDKTLFDEMYSVDLCPWGIRGSPKKPTMRHCWWGRSKNLEQVATNLLAQPGFAQLSDMAIIGGAFGWTAEFLATQGINAVSVEISNFVNTSTAASEEQDIRDYLVLNGFDPDALPIIMGPDWLNPLADPWGEWLRPDGLRTSATIVDEDMSNGGSRQAVKQSLNNNMDGILTEFVLDAMETEAESLQLAERCEQLRPNPAVQVVHLVDDSAEGDPRMVSKTKVDWKALLVANGFNHLVASNDGVWI